MVICPALVVVVEQSMQCGDQFAPNGGEEAPEDALDFAYVAVPDQITEEIATSARRFCAAPGTSSRVPGAGCW